MLGVGFEPLFRVQTLLLDVGLQVEVTKQEQKRDSVQIQSIIHPVREWALNVP